MVCPVCGMVYGKKSRFCISCGNELVDNNTNDFSAVNDNDCSPPCDDTKNDIINDTVIIFDDISSEDEAFVEGIECKGIIPDENIVNSEHNDILPSESNTHKILNEDMADNKTTLKTRSKENIAIKIGKGALSFGTSLLMTMFILLAFGSFFGRLITDTSTVNELVNKSYLLSVPAYELNIIDADQYEINPHATVLDAIYTMSASYGVSKDNIRSVYDSPSVRDFLSENIDSYASYLRTGNPPEKITASSIKEVFSENLELINSVIGTTLTQKDIDMAYGEIEKTTPVLEQISADKLEENPFKSFIAPLRLYISVPVFIAEVSAALFFAAIIFAVNKRMSVSLKWISFPAILSGLCIILFSFLASLKIIFSSVSSASMKSILYSITDILSGKLYLTGVALIISGILIILISQTIKTSQHHKKIQCG